MMFDTTRAEVAIDGVAVTKRYGPEVAVDAASFHAPWGCVTGLVGHNGAGKTTLLRMLAGFSQPDEGEILVAGRDYRSLPSPRHVVGIVSDRLGAHPDLSGRRHLELVAQSAGIGRSHVARTLEEVGLDAAAHRPVRTYSTGMKQRLAIATALLGEPPLLVLDEPSSGLDIDGIRWLRLLVRRTAAAGGAVLISTHQLSELATVVDHIVAIDKGRIVTNSAAVDVCSAPDNADLESAIQRLLLPGTSKESA